MLLEANRKATVADRIGTISEDRDAFAPAKGERLSHRASLLINLAASAALYGAGYFAIRGIIHLVVSIAAG